MRGTGTRDAPTGQGTSQVVITYEDVDEISRSLSQYLESAEGSNLEDREYLIQSAKGPGFIDEQGTVRINGWVLDPSSNPLLLRIRLPGWQTGSVMFAYVATLVHDDHWQIATIQRQIIHRR